MAFSFAHSHGSVLKVSHRCYASFSSTFDSVSFSCFECFPFQPHRCSVSCFCRCVFRSLPVSFLAWVRIICNLFFIRASIPHLDVPVGIVRWFAAVERSHRSTWFVCVISPVGRRRRLARLLVRMGSLGLAIPPFPNLLLLLGLEEREVYPERQTRWGWKPSGNRPETIQNKGSRGTYDPTQTRRDTTTRPTQNKPRGMEEWMDVPAKRIETMEIRRIQDKQQPTTRNFGGWCGRKDPPDNANIRPCHACEYRQEGMG